MELFTLSRDDERARSFTRPLTSREKTGSGESMYFVYILKSLSDQGWYTGYTENVHRRLEEHNSGKNISTHGRRPFMLIYYEAYLHKLDALGRERFLKSGAGRKFLEKQMRHYLSL